MNLWKNYFLDVDAETGTFLPSSGPIDSGIYIKHFHSNNSFLFTKQL